MPPIKRLATAHKRLVRRFIRSTPTPSTSEPQPAAHKGGCSSCGQAIKLPKEKGEKRHLVTHQRALGFIRR